MFSKKKKEENELIDDLVETDTFLDDDESIGDTEASNVAGDFGKTPRKKLPGWVIIIVIAVIVVIAIVGSKLAGSNKKDAASSLTVSKVTKSDIKEVYNASGTVESENTKTYYSPVTAPISQCTAVLGQSVKAGTQLVTFDTTNLERDNQQAQLSLQSSLNSSQTSREQNAKSIDAANASSAASADSVNAMADKVNSLGAQVDAAWAQYQQNQADATAAEPALAQKRSELQESIDEQNAVIKTCQDTITNVETGYVGRRADLDAAKAKPEKDRTEDDKATIQALEKIFEDYDKAVKDLPAAQEQLASDTAEMASLTNNVDDAGYAELQAQYDAAYAEWQAAYNAISSTPAADSGMSASQLSALNISDNMAELSALTPAELVAKGKEGMKADMDGVIASVEAAAGTSAAQGGALFSIASTQNVRVSLEVSPDDYDKMKVGNDVTVKIGDYTYKGTLSKVNKIALNNAKGNPVIGAMVHINNPDENVCIGATAKITMTVAEADNVLTVPSEVINSSTDGEFVYVIENGVVKEKSVTLGTASTTKIEIKSGLKEGEQVVNDLNVDIKKGMKATAVEKTADPASNK